MLANIPATQTVIEINSPGGPEVLVPGVRPVPEPKTGEVLIRIAAAGVNRADCLQRMGRYPMPPGAPDIPGLECAGTIVKRGDGVTQWQDGDQVCALMIGDGYGEYAAVPAVQCLPIPHGVSLIDAGGLPETFCTVWTNVSSITQSKGQGYESLSQPVKSRGEWNGIGHGIPSVYGYGNGGNRTPCCRVAELECGLQIKTGIIKSWRISRPGQNQIGSGAAYGKLR